MENIQQKINEYEIKLKELQDKENDLKVKIQVAQTEKANIESELKAVGIDIENENVDELLIKIENKIKELEQELTTSTSS